MNSSSDPSEIKISSILLQFCSNPTPFKPIAHISGDASLSELKALFMNSPKKRKVIAVDMADGKTVHIGWNELNNLLENQGISLDQKDE